MRRMYSRRNQFPLLDHQECANAATISTKRAGIFLYSHECGYRPRMHSQKWISQESFPAYVGFVPGVCAMLWLINQLQSAPVSRGFSGAKGLFGEESSSTNHFKETSPQAASTIIFDVNINSRAEVGRLRTKQCSAGLSLPCQDGNFVAKRPEEPKGKGLGYGVGTHSCTRN